MDMRRLQEAQSVLAKIDHLAVLVALDAPAVVPAAQVELDARGAAGKRRVGRGLEEAVHAAALVGSKCSRITYSSRLGSSTSDIAPRMES
jgi:hypothetical protein